MKNNKYIKWILSVVGVVLISSCIPDNLNNNPTASTQMDPNLQIPTVQLLPSNYADEWHRYFIYPGGFMNQWTNDWAVIAHGGAGVMNDSYFANMWDEYYPLVILNVVDLVERTRDIEEYTNIHAIGLILKVENFLRLTDYYGDIPYFEAGMAFYSGSLKPAYDKQEDIYMDFFEQLKTAHSLLSESQPRPTSDLYYNGDISKWKKYANSLRLRIAMRLVKVKPEIAKAEAEDAVRSGVFTSNADICYVQHDNVQTVKRESGGNGIANRLLDNAKSSTFRLAKELIGTMETLKDPRIRFYGGSYLEDAGRPEITDQVFAHYHSYASFALGAQLFSWSQEANIQGSITIDFNGESVSVPALLQYLQPSKLITNPGSPHIRMSYAEVEFLKADAAQRGYNVGESAASLFTKGLEAAVRQWTLFEAKIDEAALTTFINANPLKSGQELEQINTQLWVLHFLDPFETWSNWRRTGLPDIKFYNYHAGNQSDGQTPRRIPYPVSEQTSNPEGLKSAVDRMGGKDEWTNRVWWDVK